MDVDKELAAVDRRIKRSIERATIIASARAAGMTPEAYAHKVDSERAEQAAQSLTRAAEQIGAAYRRMNDTLMSVVDSFAAGWKRAGRR